jgi:hypothetical protein
LQHLEVAPLPVRFERFEIREKRVVEITIALVAGDPAEFGDGEGAGLDAYGGGNRLPEELAYEFFGDANILVGFSLNLFFHVMARRMRSGLSRNGNWITISAGSFALGILRKGGRTPSAKLPLGLRRKVCKIGQESFDAWVTPSENAVDHFRVFNEADEHHLLSHAVGDARLGE